MGDLARTPVINLKAWGPIGKGTNLELDLGSAWSGNNFVRALKTSCEAFWVVYLDIYVFCSVSFCNVNWFNVGRSLDGWSVSYFI